MQHKWLNKVEDGAVLVTVNQRLSRHYVQTYNQHQLDSGNDWWETPSILPLSAWLHNLHASFVLHGASNKTLMPDIVAGRLWNRLLSEDSASSELLDIELAARNAKNAWRIARSWGCPGCGENDTDASEDHLAFAKWRNSYVRHCEKNQLIDSVAVADQVQQVLAENQSNAKFLAEVLPAKLLLAGFLSKTKQLTDLIDSLESHGVAIEFVEPSNKAVSSRMRFPDDDSVFPAIATQTRALLHEQPSLSLGVVVPDLQARRGQVLRAFDSVFFPPLNPDEVDQIGRPYDLSIGLPLTEQSVVRTALLFLKLTIRGLNATELSTFLMSPYLPGDESDVRDRERLDRRCRDKRIRKVSFFDFLKMQNAGTPLRKSLEKVSKSNAKWKKSAGAAIWADYFGKALAELGWPGKSIDSAEFQAVDVFGSCLDDLQILDDGEQLNNRAALDLLKQVCTDRVFQTETPATPIQIMGRLESHGLHFDQLWVTGLDSDQWPPVTAPTSFIPLKQQQAAGVPDASPATRLAAAEQEIELWKNSVDTLFLCYADTRDGLELMPASVIATIPESSIGVDDADFSNTVEKIKNNSELLSTDDACGPIVADGASVGGGSRLLENQALCPFKAFSLHRLKVKQLEEAGIGLDPRQHGTLFHLVMEFFWDRVKSHENLMSIGDEDLEKIYGEVIDRAVAEVDMEPAQQSLQKRFLHRLMSDWVEKCEKHRLPFEVVQLEQRLEVEIAGIQINVIIDRVDKLASGQTVVVDYKTGRNNSINGWAKDRIESPQLPLYSSTNEEVEGVVFGQAFPNQYKFIGTTSEDRIVGSVLSPGSQKQLSHKFSDWDSAREHWTSSLNMLANEVKDGLATITPVSKACDYCDLSPICRIDPTDEDVDAQDSEVTLQGTSS